MTSPCDQAPPAGNGWRKIGALALAVAALGLPLNHISAYVVLVLAAVLIFSGEVSARSRRWIAAAGVVLVAVAGELLLSPPRVVEGHNLFLPGPPDGALQRGLPADVYRRMAAEFDAQYPPSVRCRPGAEGCWLGSHPARTFAFSADGILHPSEWSRDTTRVDFSNPVWLRLGFVNELAYNWYTAPPDVHRADRDRRFFMGLARWRLAMPWFEAIRLPSAFVGGELCWRGEVMWESKPDHFVALPESRCRTIAPADAGRRVFGIAIRPASLAMHLAPPFPVRLLQWAQGAVMLGAVCAVVLLLVRIDKPRATLALLLLGLAALVIAVDDASFLGGVRPFDGGDDGLFYDGIGRLMLQKALAGNLYGALEGGEKVFYYGGPGLRYFRAVEHVLFGESYLGYLSLVLILPFLLHRLARRFVPAQWALVLVVVFTAIPVGHLFGTSFIDYSKWAGRGFADPAAYILFVAGLLPIVGTRRDGPGGGFATAFGGALLLALAIFMKPIVAPAAVVILAGSGLAALGQQQWRRAAGLCVGFVPVLSMALHNWVYGHVFVPLSTNAALPQVLVMPPSAYAAAARELLRFDFGGGYVLRALAQLAHWLAGPAQSYATVPVNTAGIAILVHVVVRGRGFDAWLRLIGAAALAQHAVALFYVATPRYHFLSWLLTMLVAVVWLHEVGVPWLQQRYPDACRRLAGHPLPLRLGAGLSRLQQLSVSASPAAISRMNARGPVSISASMHTAPASRRRQFISARSEEP